MYDVETIKERLEESGELMVVLESDREYELHTHSTEFDESVGLVISRGMHNGEYIRVEFPAERVEHVYTHESL